MAISERKLRFSDKMIISFRQEVKFEHVYGGSDDDDLEGGDENELFL